MEHRSDLVSEQAFKP